MGKNRINIMYRAVQILALALGALLVVSLGPSVAVYAKGCWNRSNYCSMARTLSDIWTLGKRLEYESEVNGASKLLRSEDGKMELWESPSGQWWLPPGNGEILGHLEAERRQSLYGEPPCQPGDIVIDCGAHVGTFTRLALSAGASCVVAIEPSPANVACLRRNFKKEVEQGLVIVVEKGVWHEEDELLMELRVNLTAADRVIEGGSSLPTVKVPLTTIDRIVAELGLESVDMIKMDIEGAERNALRGAWETIAHYAPRLAISTYHLPDDPEEIPRIISGIRPEYKISCRFCGLGNNGDRVVPQVMYFD